MQVIAVDQDALSASAEGTILVNNSNVMSAQVSVWHKPLADGSRAVALLNTGLFDAATYNLTLTSEMAGLQPVGTAGGVQSNMGAQHCQTGQSR